MQISGKITWISEVQSGEGKNGAWNKFQAVITEQEGKYPQSICFEVFNDKIFHFKADIAERQCFHAFRKSIVGRHFADSHIFYGDI
jgi:hypothetical protein